MSELKLEHLVKVRQLVQANSEFHIRVRKSSGVPSVRTGCAEIHKELEASMKRLGETLTTSPENGVAWGYYDLDYFARGLLELASIAECALASMLSDDWVLRPSVLEEE
jgi:hypothetical protein